MNPYSPLLPQHKRHGYLEVQALGGVIEVPLVGRPGEDAALLRMASAFGRFLVTVHTADPGDDFDRSL